MPMTATYGKPKLEHSKCSITKAEWMDQGSGTGIGPTILRLTWFQDHDKVLLSSLPRQDPKTAICSKA